MTPAQLKLLAVLIAQTRENGNWKQIPKTWLHATRAPENWHDKDTWLEDDWLNTAMRKKLDRKQVEKIIKKSKRLAEDDDSPSDFEAAYK